MIKYPIKLGGTFVIAGGILLSGCSSDDNVKEIPMTEQPEQTEDLPDVETGEDVTLTPSQSSSFMISEYSSFKEFMKSIKEDVAEGSEYRQSYQPPEAHLAGAVQSYSEYFEYEIKEMGLKKDFNELNEIGRLTEQSGYDGKDDYNQHAQEFVNKVNEIASKVEDREEVSGAIHRLGKWASIKSEYLSAPLHEHELKQANYDEGLEYFIKAREVSADIPKQAMTENDEIAKTISRIMELSMSILSQQHERTTHLGIDGISPEDIQYADQWKPVSEHMRKTFEELQQVIDGLAEQLNNG